MYNCRGLYQFLPEFRNIFWFCGGGELTEGREVRRLLVYQHLDRLISAPNEADIAYSLLAIMSLILKIQQIQRHHADFTITLNHQGENCRGLRLNPPPQ